MMDTEVRSAAGVPPPLQAERVRAVAVTTAAARESFLRIIFFPFPLRWGTWGWSAHGLIRFIYYGGQAPGHSGDWTGPNHRDSGAGCPLTAVRRWKPPGGRGAWR